MESTVSLNGIDYAWPRCPVIVVCIDGGDPAYLDRAIEDGIVPNMERFRKRGFFALAKGTVPSFTCPNNMSLITGAPPSVHGISGNFTYDVATGQAVVMTGPELLRSRTILAQFADAGARVVAVTAKDKLRRQLGKDLVPARGDICFSAECADQCTLAENGIENVLGFVGAPLPDMYSMDLSLFVLDAGVRLLEAGHRDIMYLSLTDFIQHKHPPGDPVANEFYRRLDGFFGRLDEMGAILALTADHGMSDKSLPDGRPNVIFLQDSLDEAFGRGSTRVICPITDAFVRHHGALGGFVRVWCLDSRADPENVIEFVQAMPGVLQAMGRIEACERFDLPPDREGDVAVIAQANVAIGAARADHDLSALGGGRLRSHGGTTEAEVPILINVPVKPAYRARASLGLHSHEIFDFALNGVMA
jgi:phosphonoacetate hydrolase